jgi:hypothetical protein
MFRAVIGFVGDDEGAALQMILDEVQDVGIQRLCTVQQRTKSIGSAGPARISTRSGTPPASRLARARAIHARLGTRRPPGMKNESANQSELGLHYNGALVDANVLAYHNRDDNLICLIDTGNTWYWDEEDEYLSIRQRTHARAIFHGFKGEATFHLAVGPDIGCSDLRVYGDTARALPARRQPPRIPPGRLGAQLRETLSSAGRRSAASPLGANDPYKSTQDHPESRNQRRSLENPFTATPPVPSTNPKSAVSPSKSSTTSATR